MYGAQAGATLGPDALRAETPPKMRNRSFCKALIVAVPLCFGIVGCSGINWVWDYSEAASKARLEQKDLFIYFRRWSSAECGQIEGNWLHRSPAVAAALKDKVNCWLEWDFSQEIAHKYGLKRCPAFVLVRPGERPDEWYGSTTRTEEQFLRRLERGQPPSPALRQRRSTQPHRATTARR